jgi:hypothetical protein
MLLNVHAISSLSAVTSVDRHTLRDSVLDKQHHADARFALDSYRR